jgi:hypothetical protein
VDVTGFWGLIERFGQEAKDQQGRAEWLTEALAQLPAEEILDFEGHLNDARVRIDTWHLWGAAYRICDSLCSDDGFHHFQAWLIGLGRETFERVAADPDALADVPEIQRLAGRPVGQWPEDEWPDFEALDYVAGDAHEQVTGEEDGLDEALDARGWQSLSSPQPTGEPFDLEDESQARQRYPRLAVMFPLTDLAERDRLGEEAFARLLTARGLTEAEYLAEMGIDVASIDRSGRQ